MSKKAELQASLKSSGTAWVLFLFLGAHYAYVGKWGLQILYYVTFGGFGIWTIISFFLIGGLIRSHNTSIYAKIEELDQAREQRNIEKLAMMTKS